MTHDQYPNQSDPAENLARHLAVWLPVMTAPDYALTMHEAGVSERRDLLVNGRYMLNREYDVLHGVTEGAEGEKDLLTRRLAESSRRLITDSDRAPNAWNFLYEAEAYVSTFSDSDNRVRSLGDSFRFHGVDMRAEINRIRQMPNKNEPARRVLRGPLSDNDILAGFMLARAELREGYMKYHYGEDFVRQQRHMAAYLTEVLPGWGVKNKDVRRAVQQVNASKLAGQDHLLGYHGSGVDGRLGDYVAGTFMVHVQLGGSAERPEEPRDFVSTARHELGHAASVQQYKEGDLLRGKVRASRCGLRIDNLGTEPNEAVIEFLARSSHGHQFEINPNNLYDRYVAALLMTKQRSERDFVVIIQGVFSEELPENLESALRSFYDMLDRITV